MRRVVDTNPSLPTGHASRGKSPRREQLRMTIRRGFRVSVRALAALAMCAVLCATMFCTLRTRTDCRAGKQRSGPPAQAQLHHAHPPERPASNSARRPRSAHHQPASLVSRRRKRRAPRTHRLRAPLRAPDVQRLGARSCRGTFAHHRSRRRIRQRRNHRRHYQFLRNFPEQLSRARPVARSRPHGQPERQRGKLSNPSAKW